jgi:predicted nucleotide-binding protein
MAVLVIEDDLFYGRQISELLNDYGIETLRAGTAEDALKIPIESYDAVVIDVMLPNDPGASGISLEESRGGFWTGVAVARKLRKEKTALKVLLITGDVWGSESEEWARSQGIPLVAKSDGQKAIRDALKRLGIIEDKSAPRAFIVHGHDEVALLQLKNYLQNTLHWQEPVILREQPSGGKTIIEKFEDVSEKIKIDCVFVLLTPDDKVDTDASKDVRRSRQNVIFELGFFYAQFGRESGRVIVLHKGPNELPTDIQGIVWIGLDNGVEAAGEELRRELKGFLVDL